MCIGGQTYSNEMFAKKRVTILIIATERVLNSMMLASNTKQT
jgi:hypothetical protein